MVFSFSFPKLHGQAECGELDAWTQKVIKWQLCWTVLKPQKGYLKRKEFSEREGGREDQKSLLGRWMERCNFHLKAGTLHTHITLSLSHTLYIGKGDKKTETKTQGVVTK